MNPEFEMQPRHRNFSLPNPPALIHHLYRVFLLVAGVIFHLLIGVTPVAGGNIPEDITFYTITATYDPETHIITATQQATYRNISSQVMPELILHLYLNAFSNPETLWMREAGSSMRGYAYDPRHPGWIRISSVQLENGKSLQVEPVDEDATLVRIPLPEPILPGDEVTLNMNFTAQLPRVFARTGWEDEGEFVLAGQWFPKYGIWQQGNWNAYPFHANSEFFADFGTYTVTLTLPEKWVIGTTTTNEPRRENKVDGTVTYTFIAQHVVDFVWAASPHFREMTSTQNGISVRILYYPIQHPVARRVSETVTRGLELYNSWYGTYGDSHYPYLTVVIVPPDAGGAGGMEYPTLFTVGSLGSNSPSCLKLIEVETLHELAHQWFQSVIATNEAEEPWLDEGFTDYSTVRAMETLYDGAVSTCGRWDLSYLAMQRASYLAYPQTPMAGKAWDFGIEYSIATYAKPVVALSTLERVVGEREMLNFLKTYFQDYAFRHPTGDDVQHIMTKALGAEKAIWFFDNLVESKKTMDAAVVEFEPDYILLEREGELCVPTTVRVQAEKQFLTAEEDITWSCESSVLRLDGAYTSVEIDPDRSILLDLNLANNYAYRKRDYRPWFGILTRLTNGLQNFYWGIVPW